MTMKTIKEIKGRAAELLKSCWAESVLMGLLDMGIICLTYSLLLLTARITGVHTAENMLLIPERISPSFAVAAAIILEIYYVFTTPLYFGTRWFFWQTSGGKDIMPVSSLFAGYATWESIKRCLRLKLSMDIHKLPPLFISAGLVLLEIVLARVIWQSSSQTAVLKVLLVIGCIIMTAAALTLYSMLTMQYIPVGYIMADDPYAAPKDIIKHSLGTSKKKYFYMMKMYADNIRLFPLSFFIFPILVLRPYFLMMTAVFIRECMEADDDMNDKKKEENSIPALSG